jgi:calsyntenin 1
VNGKVHPTIGRRNIQVSTTVSCPMKKAVRLPTIDTFIMINEVNGRLRHENTTEYSLNTEDYQDKDVNSEIKPQITISGSQNNLVVSISFPCFNEKFTGERRETLSFYDEKME